MKGIIKGKCRECGNNTFKLEKAVEGKNETAIFIDGIFMHDGFGWDLNSFDIICSKCKSINEDGFVL